MNADHFSEGAPAADPAAADATASMTRIRQEEQSQQEQGQHEQGQHETAYPAVDFGSCWYHEDALKTGGQ